MTIPSHRGHDSADLHRRDAAADPGEPAPTVFGPTDVDPAALPGLAPNQLEVTTSATATTTTVRVRGELLQETALRFTDAVADLADDAEVTDLVVDLTATAFMDSTGLGTLVSLRNQVLVRGGRFAVVRPADRVFRLFELTRLDTVFEFVDAR